MLPSLAKVYWPVHDAGLAGCAHCVGQLSAPSPDVKPGGQGVQASALEPLNVPAAQMEQTVAPEPL